MDLKYMPTESRPAPGFELVIIVLAPRPPQNREHAQLRGRGGEDGRNEDPELAGSDYVTVI